jgi:hypothetical protein
MNITSVAGIAELELAKNAESDFNCNAIVLESEFDLPRTAFPAEPRTDNPTES